MYSIFMITLLILFSGHAIVDFYMSEKAKESYGDHCMEYLRIANTTGEIR